MDIQETLSWAQKAFETGDYAEARRQYTAALALEGAPPHQRSYAQLRIAQSWQQEGNSTEAKAAYQKVAENCEYPGVHRYEAGQCIKEIDRAEEGLPAYDVGSSRTALKILKPAVEFCVSPDGRDDSPGTREEPFKTLLRAREAVRELKRTGLPEGGVAVTLMPGEYPMASTFALSAEDSGTAEAPIVYRAEDPGSAVLYGGQRLTDFTRVTDPSVLQRLPEEARGQVYQCDLGAQGITDYGELSMRGFGLEQPAPPTLELYADAQPQTLARWPNEGFVPIKSLVEPGNPETNEPSVIEYEGDRPSRWAQAKDPWLFGYFKYLWADSTIQVAKIDTEAKTVTTAEPYGYGNSGMSTEQGIIFYAFNLLEELDTPGEWYVDRDTGMLYFWPPTDPASLTIEIGMLSTPMLTMDGVDHVRVEGLMFDLARYKGITITGGTQCCIAGCTVTRFADNGITIVGGQGHGIYGCDIHTIGRRATEVIGGDRETLTPGEHFVENCQIHNFGRIDRTYTPAIQLEGVGNRVAHNLMYDCPSSVMRIEGNDHLIEYNEVHSAVQESDDQGAMELFLNPTYRGVVFRHNYFHDNGKTGSEAAVHGQAAIRLDDAISGIAIYGNVFVRSSNGHFGAIQMNSGRDNMIDNNLFVDCMYGVSGGWIPQNSVWNMLREGRKPENFYTNDLYLSRYPKIASMMEDNGQNHLWRNVFVNCGRVIRSRPERIDTLANGVYCREDAGSLDLSGQEFAPSEGFKAIPFDAIGLYLDPYRASWPVKTSPVTLPPWRLED